MKSVKLVCKKGTMLAIAFFLSIWTVSCAAATDVIGFISSDTIWTAANSPYIARGNILVKEQVTLTINPDVTVKFGPGHSLIINGTLIAKGTDEEPIKFTVNQDTKAWGGIVFEGTRSGPKFDDSGNYVSGSILQYCTVEFGAIEVNSSSLFIEHSIIRNSGRIFVSGGEVVVIRDSTIANTVGVFVSNAKSLVLSGNSFIANTAGGINAEVETATIVNNNFRENKAKNGGGAYIKSDEATIDNNIFTGNEITERGCSDNNSGGGLYVEARIANITNNTFRENKSVCSRRVGGTDLGGGAYIKSDEATIDNNNFAGNQAGGSSQVERHGWGGGLFVTGGSVTVTNNAFIGNQAVGRYRAHGLGGGVYVKDSTAYVADNIFSANGTGGRESYGGALYVEGGAVIVTNNSFVWNEAAQGSAIYYVGSQKIDNNFIVNNEGVGKKNVSAVYIKGNPTFTGNTIVDNQTDFDVYYDEYKSFPALSASNNYWGAVTETQIRVRIHDFFADKGKALVDIAPFLKSSSTESSLQPHIIPAGHYEIGVKETFSTRDEIGRPITKTIEIATADLEDDTITIPIKVTFDEVEGYSPGRIGMMVTARWPDSRINTAKARLVRIFKIAEQNYKVVQTSDEISRTGIFTSDLQMKELQKDRSYFGSFSFSLPQKGAYLPQERVYFELRIEWPSKTMQREIPERTNILFRLLP